MKALITSYSFLALESLKLWIFFTEDWVVQVFFGRHSMSTTSFHSGCSEMQKNAFCSYLYWLCKQNFPFGIEFPIIVECAYTSSMSRRPVDPKFSPLFWSWDKLLLVLAKRNTIFLFHWPWLEISAYSYDDSFLPSGPCVNDPHSETLQYMSSLIKGS